MSITFVEKTHQYFNDSGDEYISATTFLHKFEKPFEKDRLSLQTAKKRGISQQEVLNEWAENSRIACEFGTAVHLAMETYIKGGEIADSYAGLANSLDYHIGHELDSAKAVLSEKLLWNDEYRIAGTADLIIEHNDKEFSVGDFKTNKKYNFFSEYGDTMLSPVSHLSSCQFNLYALQLSLYAYFHSIATGKRVRRLFNLYNDREADRWNLIPCNYMQHEIRVMLDWWKAGKVR